ncbi:transcriptional repressor [Mycobacterium intracellulare]|uniref:transcriptional repressor n=1 Tax=Mycobacterium intracellulare TaxID=1767 RepID=UPI00280B3F16|nr:transcriptional repressor [Mycobacterium intracellulare]
MTVEGGVTTYRLETEPHHHAVCTRCGSIIEVPARQLGSALEQLMAGSSLALSERAGPSQHGLCPECQARGKGPLTETERDSTIGCGGERPAGNGARYLKRSATAHPVAVARGRGSTTEFRQVLRPRDRHEFWPHAQALFWSGDDVASLVAGLVFRCGGQ